MASYVTFVLSLFVPHLSFFWCFGGAEFRDSLCSNILKNSPPKPVCFQIKILIYFKFLLKTYLQSMF